MSSCHFKSSQSVLNLSIDYLAIILLLVVNNLTVIFEVHPDRFIEANNGWKIDFFWSTWDLLNPGRASHEFFPLPFCISHQV